MCLSQCRGGKICLTDHFKPLWARNVPKFGIAHAMALGVSARIQCYLVSLDMCNNNVDIVSLNFINSLC